MLDSLAHLVWREPLWLWLALCPWLLWIVRGFLGRPRGRDYADSHLMPWARSDVVRRFAPRRFWRHAVLALTWLLFAMAMAGPRVAKTVYDQDNQRDTQLMVVLDVSRSMTARDVAPSRLERAKLELEDLFARARRLKIGLVIYAARPHLMTPPTQDKSVLRHDLQAVHHGILSTEGSNLPGAIEFAAGQFTSNQAARVLLLVTDGETPTGETTAEAKLADSVTLLAQQGIALYALGVGTQEGAPLQSPQGGWLSYRDKPVVSTLHEHRLEKLVQAGNGRYAVVSDTDAEWRKLYDQNIRYLHAAGARSDNVLTEWQELYAWCLIPASLLLLIAYGEPRRGSRGAVTLWLAALVFSGSLPLYPAQAASQSWQQRAYQAYGKRSYLEAKQAYARVAGYAGRMGEGSSAYRLGEFQEAVQLFTQAILDAETDAQRALALFNLANSRYQLEDYAAAAALYRQVLLYDPNDKAAQLNLSFAVALQKQLQRDSGDGGKGKPGRGPRSVRLAKQTDVVSGNMSMDDKDEAKRPAVPITDIQPPSDSTLLEHSRPAVTKVTEFKDSTWQYATTSPERIVLQANSLKVDQSILWKRIFEAEEGFPAPIETPRELPEMPPW